jgi:hypothetical protein
MMRTEDPARSKRVTDTVVTMVKLDIAALEKAYRARPSHGALAPGGPEERRVWRERFALGRARDPTFIVPIRLAWDLVIR